MSEAENTAENEGECISSVVEVKQDVYVNEEVPLHFVSQSLVGKRRRKASSEGRTYKRRKEGDLPSTSTDLKAVDLPSTSTDLKGVDLSHNPVEQQEGELLIEAHASQEEGSIEIALESGTLHVYVTSLRNCAGFTWVDGSHTAFMLHDIHMKTATLSDKCVIVKRRSLQIGDHYIWMYACSCEMSRWEIVDALSSVLDENPTVFDKYPECLHIRATEIISQEMDEECEISASFNFQQAQTFLDGESDHVYGRRQKMTEFHGLESLPTAMCVTTYTVGEATTYDVVVIDFQTDTPKVKCTSHCCRKISDCCRHVKSVLDSDEITSDVSEAFLKLLNEKPKYRSRYIPVALSEEKISFSRNTNVRPKTFSGNDIILKPTTDTPCVCGSHWSDNCIYRDCCLFMENDIVAVKVGCYRCSNPNCGNVKNYDGSSDEVLHMGAYLICHGVLRRYMRQFVTEGSTMISFYKEWTWQQQQNGNSDFIQKLSPYRFRYAWYAFLTLLDLNYHEAFACSECGDTPNIIVMDGVALGMKQINFPPVKTTCHLLDEKPLEGSHSERVFIQNRNVRKILKKYSKGECSAEEGEELLKGVEEHQPNLLPLLKRFFEEDFVTVCPKMFSPMLDLLSSSSPVCGWLHYDCELFSLLEEMASGKEFRRKPSNLVMLKEKCPILSSLVTCLNTPTISDELGLVLATLVDIAKRPFRDTTTNTEINEHPLPSEKVPCSCHQSLGFFPSLPVRCHRGNYLLDKKKESVDKCSKRGSSHPTLSPGLFTISCQHGICYGFQLMENVESPNIPFTIIRTRFSKAPRLIIYDNACNLHNYALNRDPAFFRDSWFLVDRFHWFNHSGCHAGYNISTYPELNKINTQAAEQRNSTLKKLKPMLSYMNCENFVLHCKFFLWFRSMITLSSQCKKSGTDTSDMFGLLAQIYCRQ